MSTTNCVWDGNSQTETKYDDELDYNNLWEPWKNIIISVKTATANISHLQKIAKRKNKQINTHDFAEALEDRNLLQHTITIQIASNGNFISIEFGKQETMEQFCCEPLSIQGFNITFYPERRKKQLKPRRLMSVSFINIPPETPEEIVTELLEQYADIEGNPMYVKKVHNGKTYCTGTRVYQITKLYQHIPRCLPNMFGRTIICIYDLQPEQQKYNKNRRQRQASTQQQTSEQTTDTDTDSDENTDNQWQQPRHYRKKQNQQKRKEINKIHNNITQRRDKGNYQMEQQPPDINDENYPQISPQPQQHQHKDTTTPTANAEQDKNEENITIIPETNLLPTTQPEETFDSPSLVTNLKNNLTQSTPEPNNILTPENNTTNKENRSKTTPKTKTQLKQEYKIYKAKKFTTQIQQTSFCDIGKLTKATKQERDTIIALSMYDRLGLYDPSNEYVINYKHKEVLTKYKEISEDRPTKNNNLLEIYNIIQNIELRG